MPTLTIDVTVAQANRVADAVGKILHLIDVDGAPRAATFAEVRQWAIDHIRSATLNQERQDALAAQVVVETPLEIP